MKISGFTFCRNAVKYDYPVVEAISSILPIVDEFVVNVGKSEDGTEDLIGSIKDEKVRMIHSVWNEELKKDGLIFSEQTNIALSHCTGDWAFYLQADEVVHEKDLPGLLQMMADTLPKKNILGLSFRYLHFYGDYFTVNPWAYRRAVRIIRNNGEVHSCGDAVGFCVKKTGDFLHPKGPYCMASGAWIYHYGYVKDPRVLVDKMRYQASRHHGEAIPKEQASTIAKERYEFDQYGIMKEFQGSHPRVMQGRTSPAKRLSLRRSRWLYWRFYKEIFTHGFKG